MHRITLILAIMAITIGCGNAAPTGAGGAASATASAGATGGAGGMAAASTGSGAPVPFAVGDATCSGVLVSIEPGHGQIVNGKPINEWGAMSARRSIPPSYPASFDSVTVQIIANVPLYFCTKQTTRVVAFVGSADGSTVHPDPLRTRVVDLDPSKLTWSQGSTGELAEPTVAIDPPLAVNDGEAMFSGPLLSDDGNGYVCTLYCKDSDHDPDSWFSALNADNAVDACPGMGCPLAHLYDSPTPAIAASNGVALMRNTAVATGTTMGAPMARILPPDAGVVCPDGSKPPCPVLTGYDSQ